MILGLRALGLGDLLTALPALRAVRRAFAADEFAVATPAALAPLVDRVGADRLIPMAPAVRTAPASVPWPGERPAVAVNLHGKGPQSTTALRALRPAELWAYQAPGGPRWRDDEHEVRRWSRLVAAYGCAPDPADLYLGTTTRDGPAVVHPGAASPQRRWPPDRFATVARALTDRGFTVAVTGGSAERRLAATVAARAGLPARAVVTGVELAGLIDLVATSPLVICGDTGVAHLASAYRVPSVILFGATSPRHWGPPRGGPHRVLRRSRPEDTATPSRRAHPSLLRIQPADVLAAVDDLVAAMSDVAAPDLAVPGTGSAAGQAEKGADFVL